MWLIGVVLQGVLKAARALSGAVPVHILHLPHFRSLRQKLAAMALGLLMIQLGTVQLVSATTSSPDEDEAPVITSGRTTLEARAISLASKTKAVLVSPDSEATCPADQLRVSWEAPDDLYTVGGYIEPIGPAPDGLTLSVNGIVVCTTSHYSYLGFEAYWSDIKNDWQIDATPGDSKDEETEVALSPNDPAVPPIAPTMGPADAGQPSATTAATVEGASFSNTGIDSYANYEGQKICDPTAKAGSVAFRNLLLSRNAGTRNMGIIRDCLVGGSSEHKEGRAFDWGVNYSNAAERQNATDTINWLLATDASGNEHAMLRRTGVMYMIWNRQIWSAYRANEGWRPYGGASAHTDHIHFSFSWAGGLGKTSYWSGNAITSDFVPPTSGSSMNSSNQYAYKSGAPKQISSSSQSSSSVQRRPSHRSTTPEPDANSSTTSRVPRTSTSRPARNSTSQNSTSPSSETPTPSTRPRATSTTRPHATSTTRTPRTSTTRTPRTSTTRAPRTTTSTRRTTSTKQSTSSTRRQRSATNRTRKPSPPTTAASGI